MLKRFAYSSASKRPKTPSKTTAERPKKKSRRAMEHVQSFDAIVGGKKDPPTRVLILGTAPSRKSRAKDLSDRDVFYRGRWTGPQFYGNPRNSFWNIVGTALGFRRDEIDHERQKQLLISGGYAIWDVLRSCKSAGSLDAQIDKNSTVPNDIFGFIRKRRSIHKIVMPNNSFAMFLRHFKSCLHTGRDDDPANSTSFEFFVRKDTPHTERTWKFFSSQLLKANNAKFVSRKKGFHRVRLVASRDEMDERDCERHRVIELVALPSTSPAASAIRPPEKEKAWHQGCFGFESRPPRFYVCVCCHAKGLHWVVDCPTYTSAADKKMLFPKDSELLDPRNGGRGYWYR